MGIQLAFLAQHSGESLQHASRHNNLGTKKQKSAPNIDSMNCQYLAYPPNLLFRHLKYPKKCPLLGIFCYL